LWVCAQICAGNADGLVMTMNVAALNKTDFFEKTVFYFKQMDYLNSFLKEKSTGGPHGTHYFYWVPVKVMNSLPVKLWKYNRPPDQDRVKEIQEYMKTSKRMDGMIYLATIGDDLVCYESNHRREALKGLEDMSPILVDFLPNTTDDTVKEEFLRLNKAVSVPELYFSQNPEQLFSDLKIAVDDFCEIYKKHKVNSNKPQRPNFNRDILMDEFYRVIKELNIDVEEFITRLSRYNRRLMLKDKTGLSSKIIDKCNDSKLWLFAWSSKLDAKEIV
jgi:hypothetical protein